MKRLPIQAAKDLAKKYDQDQVILVTWDKKDNRIHSVSYGKTRSDCKQAAIGINMVREALGFPEEKCHATPTRAKDNPPEVDYRVIFEGQTATTCVPIPPGQSYGMRKYGNVTVTVVRAHNLHEALKAATLMIKD